MLALLKRLRAALEPSPATPPARTMLPGGLWRDADGRLCIDLEFVEELHELRRLIQSAEIGSLRVFRRGAEVAVDPKAVEEWRFTGMCNYYFLLDGLHGFEEVGGR